MNFFERAMLRINGGQLVLALEYMIEYLNKTPESFWEPTTENVLIELLESLEIYLNKKDSLENLTKCFLYALNGFPNSLKLQSLFGSFMVKNGEFAIAEKYLWKAQKGLDGCIKTRLIIEKNLLYIKWNRVPRWNLRRLNANMLNLGYKYVICKAMDEGYTNVLNLGSSCDYLSLWASTHDLCSSLVSFESKPMLQHFGRQLMAKYSPDVAHYSFILNAKKTEVPLSLHESRNLIIVDMFDSGFFGLGILRALHISYFGLIQKKRFKVIPASVTLYVTGIYSLQLDRNFRIQNNIPIIKLENECITRVHDHHKYDSEVYEWYKFEVLTETVEILKFELNDESTVIHLLEGKWINEVSLVGKAEGCINCLVVSYDVYLNEDIVFSNNNIKPNELSFEQAIFHCKHPVHIKPEESVTYQIRVEGSQFNFLHEHKQDLMCEKNFSCFVMTEEAIKFLNDEKWVEYLLELSNNISDDSELYIVDFCTFPLVGLLLAKRGHQVYWFYRSPVDMRSVERLMDKNEMDTSLMVFIAYYQFPNFILQLKKLDYAIFEPVHQDGSLNESPLDNIAFRNLDPKCLFEDILVHFVLVYSVCLNDFHAVSKENVMPFEEVMGLNEYSGSEHAYFSKVDHTVMSEPETWRIKRDSQKIFRVRIENEGKINGIMVWYTLYAANGVEFSTKESTSYSTYAFRFEEREVENDEMIDVEGLYAGGSLLSLKPV